MNTDSTASTPLTPAEGKTLVTGVSGFIAGHLARALAADGVEVIGVGRHAPAKDLLTCCRYAACDLRDFDRMTALIAAHRPRTVFHLAAYSTLGAGQDEGPRGMLDTNVGATWNVLEAARRTGVSVVVVAGSDKQYGSLAIPPYSDDDSTAFLNGGLYDLSKAQQDQVARLYAGLYDAPAVRIARLVNVYGSHDVQWTRLVPGTIRRTTKGEPARLTPGRAGEALREYLHVDDCVTALRTLGADAARRGNLPLRRDDGKLARIGFNVTSGHRLSADAAISVIRDLLQNEFGIVGLPPETAPGTPGVWEAGSQFSRSEKFAALLPGWSPRPFADGLRDTIPWYLDHLRGAAH